MCASKDDGVDEWILFEEFLKGVPDEVVGTRFVELVVFHQWHPHGAGLADNGTVRIKFLNLQVVGL